VRLFNPFASRSFRIGDYTHSFARLNRRMHNKSFTADNQVAIVGGRNIGDEYFEAGTPVAFADLDTVVEGAVVRDVSVQFDAYWNSESAYPLVSLVPAADASGTATVRDAWSRLSASPAAAEYLDAVRETALVQQLAAGNLALEWVSARLVSDDPAKVLHPPERREMQMGPRLQAAMGQPSAEMDLVSPYFVPTQEGTNALVAIAARGVRVRVLTNSLAATDVAPVYAGYVKYREALLRGGVQLFELKPQRDERPSRQGRDKLRGEPAREDLRDRPQPNLHRLVQSRSALGPAQHGSGRRPGKPRRWRRSCRRPSTAPFRAAPTKCA
jgi:putative cardiolipin synthase